jgi:CRP-like cAMP-binding protein
MKAQSLDLSEAIPFKNSRLTDHERDALDSLGFTHKYYEIDNIVTAEHDDAFVLIHSGWGCLYSSLPEGDRQVLDFPLRGDLFLLSHADNRLGETLVALTELAVSQVSARSVLEVAGSAPGLMSLLISASIRHRTILVQHFNSVGRRKALARVAHLLLELGRRLEIAGAASKDGFRCPLTQYDLADALGLTAIHVNRMLRELREREFIEFRQKTIRFLDKPGLERLADFEPGYLEINRLK